MVFSYGILTGPVSERGSSSGSFTGTIFTSVLFSRRLFQQYIVDAYVACETTALTWLRTHQQSIRADVYTGLADALIREDVNTSDLGCRFILPSSFTGSDRFMQQLF
jgi:hypothetical protein